MHKQGICTSIKKLEICDKNKENSHETSAPFKPPVSHPRPQSLQSIWSAGRLSALVTVTTGCREIQDIY